jgi:hypothetical protein
LKKDIFVCLRQLHGEFPCGISMYLCIITGSGSFPLFFSFLPQSPSYGDFNRFKNSVFIHSPP